MDNNLHCTSRKYLFAFSLWRSALPLIVDGAVRASTTDQPTNRPTDRPTEMDEKYLNHFALVV